MMKKSSVVIIGAGAAGISAAARLFQNGFTEITILEAEDRLGGRINSAAFDGGIIDLGAQWCHGEEDNIVYNIAKDLNLLSPSRINYAEFALYESSGRLIDTELSNKLTEIAFQIFFDEDSLGAAKGSVGEYFMNRYNKQIEEAFSKDKDQLKTAKHFIDFVHKLVICLDSAPTWFDISAKRSLNYKHCDGNNYLNWRDRGYINILHVLMKIFPNPAQALPFDHKIVYRKEVNKITWGNGLPTVTCTDGSMYMADYVIVTVSLGVLKHRHRTLFYPALPLPKQNAIKNLGYGSAKKVFLAFPHKWWPDNCSDFNLLWTDCDRENIVKEFPHGPIKNGRSWLEDVMGFYEVDYHPKVLLVWIVGPLISELETTANDVIIDGCMFLLNKFLRDKYCIPLPSDILRSSWSTNSHFYGAYSYQSMDSEKHNAHPLHLAEPLTAGNRNAVLFAGEATHPHYFSTVHGAIETGFREADRIINSSSELHKNTTSKL